MEIIEIIAGPFSFRARMETEQAPETCRKFVELLPLNERRYPVLSWRIQRGRNPVCLWKFMLCQ